MGFAERKRGDAKLRIPTREGLFPLAQRLKHFKTLTFSHSLSQGSTQGGTGELTRAGPIFEFSMAR